MPSTCRGLGVTAHDRVEREATLSFAGFYEPPIRASPFIIFLLVPTFSPCWLATVFNAVKRTAELHFLLSSFLQGGARVKIQVNPK